VALSLPAESRQSLEIVTHSLSEMVKVYKNLGPTTDSFVELMRKRKETVIGPDKWQDIKQKVTRAEAKSMFNYKEGPKRKMLKVQYFKHPDKAQYLYGRHLAAFGRLPWNDEVPLYFAQMFYAEFFKGMKPDYNDLPSEFFGPGRGRLYQRKGAKRDVELPRPEPPLVSRPSRVETLRSEMDATSQISREARDVMIDNVHSGLSGVDLCLNRQRARENARANFVYHTDEEIYNMNVEDLRTYAINCRNGLQDLIFHEEEGTGTVCVSDLRV